MFSRESKHFQYDHVTVQLPRLRDVIHMLCSHENEPYAVKTLLGHASIVQKNRCQYKQFWPLQSKGCKGNFPLNNIEAIFRFQLNFEV